MTIDPDFACVTGAVIGQIAGALGVWLYWEGAIIPPTLALIATLAVAAIIGAGCGGYAARKAAQMWAR